MKCAKCYEAVGITVL